MAILKDALALVLHRPARAVRTGIGRAILWFTDPVEEARQMKQPLVSEEAARAVRDRLLGDAAPDGRSRSAITREAMSRAVMDERLRSAGSVARTIFPPGHKITPEVTLAVAIIGFVLSGRHYAPGERQRKAEAALSALDALTDDARIVLDNCGLR